MFKEKVVIIAPKKDNVVINMVLQVTTCSQIRENVRFKEKPLKKKTWSIGKKKKRFNVRLKKLLRTYNKKNHL